MVKKFTNVETYLIVIFLFVLALTGIVYLGNELILNDNANLDDSSVYYIANLNRVNLSSYQVDSDEVKISSITSANESQGNTKDESLEFLFAKEKGLKFEVIVKGIFSLPEVILIDVFKFSLNDWNWIIGLFNWLYRLLIIIAIYYLVRGVPT